MLHIGIVACSTEGAALCYRTISLEGSRVLGRHDHPEVSLHSHSLAQYMKSVDAGDWAGVAQLMLSSSEKLAKAGADFLICPDNTIHQAFDLLEPVLRAPGCTLRAKSRQKQSATTSNTSQSWERVT